ncbi:MAG: proprotein convertase P-domain-containing protein, partial [Phycisphaeraceae bacterium]|nr:proprotein convertase P-domain-containing protein [Phycisphaeraceae bacterium]
DSRGGSYLGDGEPCSTGTTTIGSSSDPFPLPIPDNNPAGIQSFISFNGGTFTSNTAVCVGLTHTWVGDLIITIQSPGGTVVTLIDRVGAFVPGFGDSSNLGGVYCFNDSADGDIWAEAALGDTAYVLRSGLYRPARALDGGLPFPSLADFDGENLAGTWILTVSDNAGADLGTVNSFTFDEIEFTDLCGGGCPACAADFNQDGGVDGSDVEAFYIVWESGEGCGDVNEDGGVDGGDIEFFFTFWEQGGC